MLRAQKSAYENPIRRIYEDALAFFFPPMCASCKERLAPDEDIFCGSCRSGFEYISKRFCDLCGAPIHGAPNEEKRCRNCPALPVHFTRARAALLYQGAVADGIIAFKFNRRLEMAEFFARTLFMFIETEMKGARFDVLIPVPLHFLRFFHRGYNQAEEIGRILAKMLGIPLWTEVLSRRRATKPQTRLSHAKRHANVRDAFAARFTEPYSRAHILLLDDVYTTGNTLNACSKVLKEAGAWEITAMTVCRAIKSD